MIRNIITVVILLATLITIASVAQIAKAVEPNLDLELSSQEASMAPSNHPFAWTPDLEQQKRLNNLNEQLLLPKNAGNIKFSETEESEQRLFSFEIYQGDGLDDLRSQSKHNHNSITLPDEDTSAYGVSVKQRF